MNEIVLTMAGMAITPWHLLALSAALALGLLAAASAVVVRSNKRRGFEAAAAAEARRELDGKFAELGALNAQLAGRVQAMADIFGTRQADFARLVSERLDAVSRSVGQGLETSAKATGDNLSKLNERLAVIDAAQAKLTGLTKEVVGLREILANKQSRGAFGQGRMEAIVRDGLPVGAFAFQASLSNGTRPDCVIRLPGDDRGLVIDAKFPLEAFSALKDAADEAARRQAAQRVRADFGKHVKDMAERYLLPGETQDIAVLFVPSESIYADLNEHFDDIVQKALRQRIIIVSPSLLMMAIQVMQAIVRDARMREQAHVIQIEVRKLLEDVGRLRDRVGKLDSHFRQTQEDVAGILVSTKKVTTRAERIDAMEFEGEGKMAPGHMLGGSARLPQAAE
ncbi:MAG: DNA recombination protein RmuC [Methylobacteriaceae bacterium]|nr:DNA recombination protein RmuC [Methylobacteriaceae bacterium]